jgi:2-C-methyl-D-erythritol 4-phosphate cytidylyltransferase
MDIIDEIVIVTNKLIVTDVAKLVKSNNFLKVKKILIGGKERQQSVYEGLIALEKNDRQIVLIHDAVRPFIDSELIHDIIKNTRKYGTAIPAVHAKDTIKYSPDGKFFSNTLARKNFWMIQTPQGFKYQMIINAHKKAIKSHFLGSDDSSLVERLGIKPKIVPGNEWNLKITTPQDLKIAKLIMKKN